MKHKIASLLLVLAMVLLPLALAAPCAISNVLKPVVDNLTPAPVVAPTRTAVY